ncbi:FecCD family ABC transporter permease [Actinosynnema pretiosum]|uniref:FecCD family ABC transporter permease n=1 Tax=Actinosynnema pretiosum TaxID=42197 RepID=UPI000A91FB75|nr:iron chelate uptake ABC transporter family permease subunit [Actinosynnema pretiosum]
MTDTATRAAHRDAALGAVAAAAPSTLDAVTRTRRRNARRRRIVIAVLTALILVMIAVSLMFGQRYYPPSDVLAVVLGEQVPGASFTVGRLRLPRTALATLAGLCFGLGGVSFQTMLRNPLASPDIIGISAGASAAAAFAIVVLGLSGATVAAFAIVAGLLIALLVYLLAFKSGGAGTRLVLIGIGTAAMLHSAIDWILTSAGEWDLQEALVWLTGSLNGSSWTDVLPVLLASVVLVPLLLAQTRRLGAMQLGEDAACALGVRVELVRLTVVIASVGLIAFATAACGPIAFVAFLAGPIAARLVGPGGSLLVPAMLVGSLLVLVADYSGQYLLPARYPVGVVTGVLGAPYLIYLIIRTNRAGGSL